MLLQRFFMGLGAGLAGLLLGLGEPQAQTLTEALAYTYHNNPAIAAARATLRATVETLPQARADFLPQLSFLAKEGRTRIRQSTKDEFATTDTSSRLVETATDRSIELEVTLNLYDGGQDMAAINAAEANIAVEKYTLDETEQSTLLKAAEAYADVILKKHLLGLSIQNENGLLKLKASTEDLYAHQQVTITDVAQVDAEIASATASRAQAQGDLRAARSQFKYVIGSAPAALEKEPSLPRPPPTLEEALAIAERRNPFILAAQYQLKADEFDVRAREGKLLPSVDFYNDLTREWDSSTYTGSSDYKEHSKEDSWEIGVDVTVPLYSGGATYSAIREAKQTVAYDRNTLINARNQIIEDVTSAWAALEANRTSLKSGKAQVKSAAVVIEGFQRQFKNGTTTMQELLNAQSSLINAYEAQYEAANDVFTSTATLLNNMGTFGARELGLAGELYDSDAYVEKSRFKFFGTDID
tara:strand:+ start:195 stop:1607 length:1413 start_codon:yes stop_codon:yes gene_type:complete